MQNQRIINISKFTLILRLKYHETHNTVKKQNIKNT